MVDEAHRTHCPCETTTTELRTPLHGILALCESLRERMPPRHPGRKTINTISQCGSHLLGLLNNILDFEKANSDTFSTECIPFSVACEAEKVRKQRVPSCAPPAKRNRLNSESARGPPGVRHVCGDDEGQAARAGEGLQPTRQLLHGRPATLPPGTTTNLTGQRF